MNHSQFLFYRSKRIKNQLLHMIQYKYLLLISTPLLLSFLKKMTAKFYQMCFGTLGRVLWLFCFNIVVDCCIGNPSEYPSQYSHPCVVLHTTSANWTLASMLQLKLDKHLHNGIGPLENSPLEARHYDIIKLRLRRDECPCSRPSLTPTDNHMRASTAPWETEPPLWAQTAESQALLFI